MYYFYRRGTLIRAIVLTEPTGFEPATYPCGGLSYSNTLFNINCARRVELFTDPMTFKIGRASGIEPWVKLFGASSHMP
jgi:hypothetical protein